MRVRGKFQHRGDGYVTKGRIKLQSQKIYEMKSIVNVLNRIQGTQKERDIVLENCPIQTIHNKAHRGKMTKTEKETLRLMRQY